MPRKKTQLKTQTQFKEALSYLKESQKYIYAAIIIFVLGGIFGFIFWEHLTFLNKIIAEIILKTQNFTGPELIFFILQNNLLSSLLSILLGLFFGIFPIFNAIANGTILGYVSALVSESQGLPVLWRLLPHGIFELPAIFISIALGIKLGFTLLIPYVKHYWKKNKFLGVAMFAVLVAFPLVALILISLNQELAKKISGKFKYSFYNSVNAFLLIVVPLLIIAAIIEGSLIALLE